MEGLKMRLNNKCVQRKRQCIRCKDDVGGDAKLKFFCSVCLSGMDNTAYDPIPSFLVVPSITEYRIKSWDTRGNI
jgi:hypothetical protein